MGYVTQYLEQFQNDVFLSYPRTLNETPDRWVDNFCEVLTSHVQARIGRQFKLWRDIEQLRMGGIWRAEIGQAIESTAVFVALINSNYFDSDVCIEELNSFLREMKSAGKGPRKLVPVFHRPTTPPPPVSPMLNEIGRHEFFFEEDGRFRELHHRHDEAAYWKRMMRMVDDLEAALRSFAGAQPPWLGKVFIGRCRPELHEYRDRLRCALRQHRIQVVPEREYLWSLDGVDQSIAADLSGALLSVHLVGTGDSTEREIAERDHRQIALALSTMAADRRPPPLVWIAGGRVPAASQAALIAYIDDQVAGAGAEVLRDAIDELESLVIEQMPKPQPAVPPRPVEVALFVPEADHGSFAPLRGALVKGLGLKVRTFRFDGSAPEDPDQFDTDLAGCRDVLVFCARADDASVAQLLDLPPLVPWQAQRRVCVVSAGAPAGAVRRFACPSFALADPGAPCANAALATFLAAGAAP